MGISKDPYQFKNIWIMYFLLQTNLKSMKSLAEKSCPSKFEKGPEYPTLYPPILRVYVEAPGNFLSIYLSSLLSPEFVMDLV